MDTKEGLIIITGCAHPGIVDMVKKATKILPGKKIYLVMSGFHLSGDSYSEIEEIIEVFRNLAV